MRPEEPCLVLDGSARHGVRVGLLRDGRWAGQGASADGPLEAVFACVKESLAEAGLSLDEVRSFAVCAGPGSVLGIRVACLAVRTWTVLQERPIRVWQSLDALALLARAEGGAWPFVVVQPSRLKRWNRVEVGADGVRSDASEISPEALAAETRPVFSDDAAALAVHPGCRLLGPCWPRLPEFFALPGFLRLEPRPDALNPAAEFAAWSGERHRGPSA